MRARVPAALLALLTLIPLAHAAEPLYVALDGKDTNSGAREQPFSSLPCAVQAARAAGAPARIIVQPGSYFLSQPIALGPEDSGLAIEGVRERPVVLSGGRRVGGWKPWRDKILQADLSGVDLPDLSVRELYYNGRLMQWARYPNFDPAHPRTGGFLQNAALAEAGTKTKFVYAPGQLNPAKWAHPERAWMMFHDSLSYETQYCPVKGFDADKRIVEAERGVYVLSVGNPYYLCGLPEELDAPGEWCVDPDARMLYFWPPTGALGQADEVIVPALTSAFVLKGDPAQDRWVRQVRLSGLAIRDCRGRAVQMTGARDCAVTACDLRNAEVGVYLGDDTHACRVAGCDITQCRATG